MTEMEKLNQAFMFVALSKVIDDANGRRAGISFNIDLRNDGLEAAIRRECWRRSGSTVVLEPDSLGGVRLYTRNSDIRGPGWPIFAPVIYPVEPSGTPLYAPTQAGERLIEI